MPSYTLNLHRHVKIWLSGKPEEFLPFEDQQTSSTKAYCQLYMGTENVAEVAKAIRIN